MELPPFLLGLIDAIARCSRETATREPLRAALLDGVAEAMRDALRDLSGPSNSTVPDVVNSARAVLKNDVERFTIFAVLMRSYESQERRDGGFDASLGVLFAAMFVIYGAVFNWIHGDAKNAGWYFFAAVCFLLSQVATGIPLFFWKSREPSPTELALGLVEDLRHPERGTAKHLRQQLGPQTRPKAARLDSLGAAGFLAVLNEYLRISIRNKRALARTALLITMLATCIVGGEHMLRSLPGGSNGQVSKIDLGPHHGQSQQQLPGPPSRAASVARRKSLPR